MANYCRAVTKSPRGTTLNPLKPHLLTYCTWTKWTMDSVVHILWISVPFRWQQWTKKNTIRGFATYWQCSRTNSISQLPDFFPWNIQISCVKGPYYESQFYSESHKPCSEFNLPEDTLPCEDMEPEVVSPVERLLASQLDLLSSGLLVYKKTRISS